MMIKDPDLKFTRVPNDVIADERLNKADLVVYLNLASLERGGTCHPSILYLAKFCRMSIKTIYKSLRTLQQLDFIEIRSGYAFGLQKKANQYFIKHPIYKKKKEKQVLAKAPARAQVSGQPEELRVLNKFKPIERSK